VWVYACVQAIASAVSSVPWCVYDKDKKNEIENHFVKDLLNKQVNNNLTSRDFFEMWAVSLAVMGKFYALFSNVSKFDKNLEIYPMYSHLVSPISASLVDAKMVSGFKYSLTETTYNPELILWNKFFDPLNFYDGLSPIRAAARTINTENQATDWNKDLFSNLGVPPGALMVQNVSQQEIKTIRDRWNKDYSGPKNARMPLILDSEKIAYINFGMSQVDMDFLEQKKLSRIEICSMFNVPGQIVGDPEGQTYANFGEAKTAFWQNTIIAKYVSKIEKALNMYLGKPNNIIIEADYSDIKALQENEDSKASRYNDLYNGGILTLNEARYALGYEAVEGGDVFLDERQKSMADALIDENAGGENDTDPSY
jgi:HK97 family phage portal protein